MWRHRCGGCRWLKVYDVALGARWPGFEEQGGMRLGLGNGG